MCEQEAVSAKTPTNPRIFGPESLAPIPLILPPLPVFFSVPGFGPIIGDSLLGVSRLGRFYELAPFYQDAFYEIYPGKVVRNCLSGIPRFFLDEDLQMKKVLLSRKSGQDLPLRNSSFFSG